MTLEEVIAAIRQRYDQVDLIDGPNGGTILVVDGRPFACPAWFPEDGVPDRFLRYLAIVLDQVDPRDLGLDES